MLTRRLECMHSDHQCHSKAECDFDCFVGYNWPVIVGLGLIFLAGMVVGAILG